MVLKNLKIVLENSVIERGYLSIFDGKIQHIGVGVCPSNMVDAVDCEGLIAMPGFIDIHIHGCCDIDFMDAKEEDYKTIANALYKEGVTTFLATTLTSDKESLARVCKTVKNAMKEVPSLGGIHFEGPYINAKYKGAQNEAFIRNPDIKEFDELQELSGENVRYITLAPEKEGALEFIEHVTKGKKVTVSAGHSDATFDQVKAAMAKGLTNTTHTHNAMSPHHHRNPGIVTAAFYFDGLYTEFICDTIHVCKNTLATSYKIIGPERFVMITDSLAAKQEKQDEPVRGFFKDEKEHLIFGLPYEVRDGAAYLLSGPLAGSVLEMDRGLRNMRDITGASLCDLAKISSRNAAKAVHLIGNRGLIEEGKLADIVLLDNDLNVKATYKMGVKVY